MGYVNDKGLVGVQKRRLNREINRPVQIMNIVINIKNKIQLENMQLCQIATSSSDTQYF